MSARCIAVLLAGTLAACDPGDPAPIAVAGEVRGAALRDFGRSKDGAVDATPEPRASREDELELEYAEVLPADEAAKYEWIDFFELTDFELESYAPGPEGGPPVGLPPGVAQLAGKLVAVEGFMNPTAFDRDGVSAFTLVADPTFCCFGVTPTLHHFIQVDLPEGEHTEFFSIVEIAVFGRLEVGLVEEDGIALSFYRMRADHVFCVY